MQKLLIAIFQLPSACELYGWIANCMFVWDLNRKLHVNYVNLANLSLPSPHVAVCNRFPWASSSLPLVAPGVKIYRLQVPTRLENPWKSLNFSNPIWRPWKYLNFVNINLSLWKFLNSHNWMNNSTLRSLKRPLK